MKKNQSFTIYFLQILLSFLFIQMLGNLYAYPKFAAYTGEKCMSCHVSPTGGAIRNAYGIKYSKDNLVLKPLVKLNKSTDFNTQLTKGIQIGADMRTLFFDDQTGPGNPDLNSFFQMQADLYVNAQINKILNLVIAPSLQYMAFSPVYEVYGMISKLTDANIFLRAGKIKPNFGIRIPEHRSYQRIYNLNTPYYSDVGIEGGISPGGFTFTAGFFNGVNNAHNDFDADQGKEIVTTADYRWASKKNKFTFDLGGSFLSNPYKYNSENNIFALDQIAAGFFSIGLYERVAILAEYDYNRNKISDSVNTKQDFHTIFGEVNIKIIQGLEAKFQYENYNPQLGIKDGSLIRNRYSFGIGIFPMTGFELESIFRLVKTPSGEKLHENEFQQTIKFYF